jgi:hypothetical protein
MTPEREYVTAEDIQQVIPSLGDAEAQRLADLVNIAFEANLCTEVPDPTPPEVVLGLTIWASTISGAVPGGLASEQIGSYSYRLANPQSLGGSLATVPTDAYNYLYPYLCSDSLASEAYQLDVAPVGVGAYYPYDPQRDLDGSP